MTACPPDFATLASHARREIAAFDFRPRESATLQLIVRLSFDRGRPWAFFQNQQQIGEILDISKGNVSGILSRLRAAGVLFIEAALGRYHMQPDSACWRVPPLYRTPSHRAAAERLEAMLAEINAGDPEQLHMFPPLPNLDAILIEESRLSLTGHGPQVPRPSLLCTGTISGNAPVSGSRREDDTASRDRDASPRDGDDLATLPVDSVESATLKRLIAASMRQYEEKPDESPAPAASPPRFPNREPSSQIGNRVPKLGTASLSALSEEPTALINASLSERGGAGRLVIPRCAPAPQTEAEILDILAQIAPQADCERYGGFWRLAARWKPVEARDALHEARRRKIEGGKLRKGGSWGGLARSLFEDFAGMRTPRWRKATISQEGEPANASGRGAK